MALTGFDALTCECVNLKDTLDDLGAEINEINAANGWNVVTREEWTQSPYKVPAILALIGSEVSEALEAFRHDNPGNFIEELADVMIRVLDCAHGLEMDMATAIIDKLEKNRKRGFRHGGKRV